MRTFGWSLLVELLLCALASAAPPQAPPMRVPAQAPAVRGGCPCGDKCDCPVGTCPASCPVQAGTVRTVSGRLIKQVGGAWVYADEGMSTQAIPVQAPVQRGYWAQQCDGKTCRMVWVPIK